MPAEIKILERAEMYLRKLSCGVNPLTEENLPETDVCKQERISKCLTYVADYLKQKVMPGMERREKVVAPKPQKVVKPRPVREVATQELVFTPEMLSKFEISVEPVSVSGVVRRLNFLIPHESGMMPLVYADVAEVLSREGVLLKEEGDKGKDLNLPTPRGEELGFAKVEADIRGHHSIYTKCNADAQKFILDNIDKCVAQANERLARRKSRAELGETGRSSGKEKFHVTEEQLKNYPTDESPVPVSEIARRLNDLLPQDSNVEKIYFKTIRDWFVAQNMLEEKKTVLGKIYFEPTEAGAQNGIVTESRVGKNGENYDAVLYNGAAQKLVLQHVNELA